MTSVFDEDAAGMAFLGFKVRPLRELAPGAKGAVIVASFTPASAIVARLRVRGFSAKQIVTLA